MDNVLILLDSPKDWHPYCSTNTIQSVADYLRGVDIETSKRKLVINLSKCYSYNSAGYYCSLLAQTKGHKVFPSIETINKLESGTGIRMDYLLQKLCYQWIQKQNIQKRTWHMTIYFGRCQEKGLERIARFIFAHYPCPLLRVEFNTHSRNQLESVQAIPLTSLNDAEEDFFADSLDKFNQKIWRTSQIQKSARFSLAILCDPEEKFPPSNKQAIRRFLEVAKRMNIHAEIITEDDSSRLLEFDALFIRTTTAINNYTFKFAQLAEQNGMVVIDDPQSIIRCSNKVYLNELFIHKQIPAPKSILLFQDDKLDWDTLKNQIGAPCILKIPDGSFSIGMKKVDSQEELIEAYKKLSQHSSIILAQAFTPSEYDWRIGILDGKVLFACKYYMAKGHWQIYHHYASGLSRAGLAETFPIHQVPPKVIEVALKATSFIGKGLYGVDLKMVDGNVFVIEINDNPNIDLGIEDQVLGDELYFRVLNHFANKVEEHFYD